MMSDAIAGSHRRDAEDLLLQRDTAIPFWRPSLFTSCLPRLFAAFSSTPPTKSVTDRPARRKRFGGPPNPLRWPIFPRAEAGRPPLTA